MCWCRDPYMARSQCTNSLSGPQGPTGKSVKMNTALLELPKARGPREQDPGIWVYEFLAQILSFLLVPPRSCSLWNDIHHPLTPCANRKAKSLFCLLKDLGQRGISLRQRVLELGEIASTFSSGLWPWNPWGNLKIICGLLMRKSKI